MRNYRKTALAAACVILSSVLSGCGDTGTKITISSLIRIRQWQEPSGIPIPVSSRPSVTIWWLSSTTPWEWKRALSLRLFHRTPEKSCQTEMGLRSTTMRVPTLFRIFSEHTPRQLISQIKRALWLIYQGSSPMRSLVNMLMNT